jgi:hypothetical protein
VLDIILRAASPTSALSGTCTSDELRSSIADQLGVLPWNKSSDGDDGTEGAAVPA